MNQLLGYASWRDTKTAILLFSKNKDFSGVIAGIPEVVRSHPNCKKRSLARILIPHHVLAALPGDQHVEVAVGVHVDEADVVRGLIG